MSPRRPDTRAPIRRAPAAAAALALALASSGCETLFQGSRAPDPTADHPGAATSAADTEEGRREVAGYLNFADVLDGTDQQGWNTIYEHTRDGYQREPTRERRMTLALVLSRADRKSAESHASQALLVEARGLFDETVHELDTTPALVRKFAQQQQNEIDRRLALYEELHSLRAQLAKAHQESQTAQRDRTEAVARMRRIDAALAEANAKLEAVLKIERNIGPTGKETFP